MGGSRGGAKGGARGGARGAATSGGTSNRITSDSAGPHSCSGPPAVLILAFLAILAGFPGASSRAGATRYEITPGKPNLVRFESKAPLETIVGTTDQVSGHILFDPAAPLDSVEARIAVNLAAVRTGIDLRDRHMRENHLETETYPQAVFEGGRIVEAAPGSLSPGAPCRFTIRGTFDLHGVSREMEIPVMAVLEDSLLRFEAEFAVRLQDHGIDRPQFLVMKLDDTQRIRIELLARRGEEK